MKWVKKGFRCPKNGKGMIISNCKKCEYFKLDFDEDKKQVPLCYYTSKTKSIQKFEDERELEIVDMRPDNFSPRMLKKGYATEDGYISWSFDFDVESKTLEALKKVIEKFEELKDRKYRLVSLYAEFKPSKELISKLKAMSKKEQTQLVFKIKEECKKKEEEIMKTKKSSYTLEELFSLFDQFPDAQASILADVIGTKIHIGIGKSREGYGFSIGPSRHKDFSYFDKWRNIAIEAFNIPSIKSVRCVVEA